MPQLKSTLRRRRWLAPLIACLLTTAACSDSPSELPTGVSPLTGTVVFQDPNPVEERLVLSDFRIVRFDIVELRPRLIDAGITPAIGFGLGEPGEEECETTFRSTIRQGDRFSFGLDEGEYCLIFFDSGNLPEDAVIDYTVTVAFD